MCPQLIINRSGRKTRNQYKLNGYYTHVRIKCQTK